jgi:CRP-like cAMP-binding protein
LAEFRSAGKGDPAREAAAEVASAEGGKMLDILVRKLAHGADLSAADVRALERSVLKTKKVEARKDIIEEGEEPEFVHVVLQGFAFRYKAVENGGRQIVGLLAPGDFCDLHIAILGRMDHAIATLSASQIAYIPRDAVRVLTQTSPALTQALWWASLVDEAVLREWLVGMGRRPADRQIAHLFCELLVRLEAVGLSKGNVLNLPLTQSELADTVGLTTVHVNRTLRHLRELGLMAWRGSRLSILDVEGLKTFAQFDPNYLHLDKARREGGLDRQSVRKAG